MTDLSIVILTFNEELHIRRAIESAAFVAKEVFIIDSYSTDQTIAIAKTYGVKILQHAFINHAQQFQWAIDHAGIDTPWVMRMDADEYLTPGLVNEINSRLKSLSPDTTGVILKRQVHFMGQWIRHGGYYPIKLLRIWRQGAARIEQRWMDEHMVLLHGLTVEFNHDIIDDNLNTLSWWTEKHNAYATREAIDLLNYKYRLISIIDATTFINGTEQAQTKRWYKNNVYARLPLFFRAWLYFIYRYWIRLGFLDGRKGLIWHFLQAFWYRFLVDAKILQIEWWSRKESKTIMTILEEKFNFRL